MSAAGKYYVFRNAFGRVLKIISQEMPRLNPCLAAALIPRSIQELAPYLEDFPREAARGFSEDSMAWIFYPNRIDEMMTRFSFVDGSWWVEKKIFRRHRHGRQKIFRQLELPCSPILEGTPVLRGNHLPEEELRDFFKGLLQVFPLTDGLLPENAVDAVPRNCIVDHSGTMRFYDLEYAMNGGTPLSYVIYRTLKADVIKGGSQSERRKRLLAAYEKWCRELGTVPRFTQDERLSRTFKSFMSGGLLRTMMRKMLSLIPLRTVRERLNPWSEQIKKRD